MHIEYLSLSSDMSIFYCKTFCLPSFVTKLDVITINRNYTDSILNVPNDDMMLLLVSELIRIKRIYQTHTVKIKQHHFLKDQILFLFPFKSETLFS